MSNFTVAQFAKVSTDARANHYKLYAGEVLTTFSAKNVILPRTMVKTITEGKSASFPVTGVVTGGYHSVGTEISGQATEQNEKVIGVDDMLVASVFIADIDEAMASYDGRSIYSNETGIFLANTLDKKLAVMLLKAAKNTTPNITGQPAGETIVAATVGTDKAVLKAKMLAAAQKFDEKNIPEHDRNILLRPAQYYLLLTDDEVINSRYDVGGSSKEATVYRYAGLDILKSNNIPNTNVTTGVVVGQGVSPNDYAVNATNTVAIVFQKGAIGTVKLRDLSVRSEYQLRQLGTLVVAAYAMGHGQLRPECAIEFASA